MQKYQITLVVKVDARLFEDGEEAEEALREAVEEVGYGRFANAKFPLPNGPEDHPTDLFSLTTKSKTI